MSNIVLNQMEPISTVRLRRETTDLVDNVYYKEKSYVIRSRGKGDELAALIPMREFKQYLEFRERARVRLQQEIERIRSAVEASGISEEEIRSLIDEEVAAYRAEQVAIRRKKELEARKKAASMM